MIHPSSSLASFRVIQCEKVIHSVGSTSLSIANSAGDGPVTVWVRSLKPNVPVIRPLIMPCATKVSVVTVAVLTALSNVTEIVSVSGTPTALVTGSVTLTSMGSARAAGTYSTAKNRRRTRENKTETIDNLVDGRTVAIPNISVPPILS